MWADDPGSSDESSNEGVLPVNVFRDGQLDEGPVGVDNDDHLSTGSTEIFSDDEEFNIRNRLVDMTGGKNDFCCL